MKNIPSNVPALMGILSRLLGGHVSVESAEDAEHGVNVTWRLAYTDGRRLLATPPPIQCHSDGTFEWTLSGQQFRFSLADLEMVDPNAEALLSRVTSEISDLALCLQHLGPCDPYALTAAFVIKARWVPKLCGLVVKAAYPGSDYHLLMRHASIVWRQLILSQHARSDPFFTTAEFLAAAHQLDDPKAQVLMENVMANSNGQRPQFFKKDPAGFWSHLF